MANLPFREPDVVERLSMRTAWQVEVTIDFDQLPLCSEAADYLAWLEEIVGAALRKPSYERLDRAVTAVTKEMLHRKKSVADHTAWPHTCIRDVFESWLEEIVEQQSELVRHRFLDPEPPDLTEQAAMSINIGTELPSDGAAAAE